MSDLNCINCDTPNLVDNITESFKCGECGEVNPGIDVDILYSDYVYLNKQYSELADRLRGHEFNVENTIVKINGMRGCKACIKWHNDNRKKNGQG